MRCWVSALFATAGFAIASPAAAQSGDLLVDVLRHLAASGPAQAPSGTLRLVDERWLVIASRSGPSEAASIAQAYGELLGGAAVVRSANGTYAVIAGTLLVDKAKPNVEALKALRLIPQDSFLADGRNFFDVLWNGIGEASDLDVMTRPAYQLAVRRMQAALSELGLYDGVVDGLVGPTTTTAFDRYIARYGTPSGEILSGYGLAGMEATAVDGFADEGTRTIARSRGFSDSASFAEASAGGFQDASGYASARSAGFRTQRDYTAALAGGFRDSTHLERARAGGFDTAASMQVAEQAGFSDSAEYERFRSSGFRDAGTFRQAARDGFSDRASFERANAERLETAREAGRELLSDADAFLRLNPGTPGLLAIAAEVATLNGALGGASAASVSGSIARLETLLSQIEAFEPFRIARVREREAVDRRLVRSLKGELELYRTGLTRWVAANLASDLLPPIVAELTLLETDIGSGDPEVLQTARDRVAAVVQGEGLADAIDVLRSADAAKGGAADVGPEPRAIASVTERNRVILEGNLDAVVILYNASTSAPGLTRNLVGDFVFAGKAEAAVCLHGLDMSRAERRALTAALSRFQAGGVSIREGSCVEEDVAAADLLVLSRGAFLEAEPAFAIRVLDALEARDLALFEAMPFDDVRKGAADEAELVGTIGAEVLSETRSGYGGLALSARSGPICADVGDERAAHEPMLSRLAAYAASEDVALGEPFFGDVETVFSAARAERCAFVYGPHASLRQIALALERDGRTAGFVPLWFESEALEEISEDLASAQAAQERQAEQRRRDRAATDAERERERADRERTKEARQSAMRRENGAKAAALSNLYADGLRALVLGGRATIHTGEEADAATLLADLFPAFGGWSKGLAEDEWHATDVEIGIDDYGLASWKDRSLETIVLAVETRLVSRTRGEYRTECHLLGAVFDGEFGMHRDPFEAPCASGAPALARWKGGHGLQSLWVAAD